MSATTAPSLTLGILLGDICEADFINIRRLRRQEMNQAMIDAARAVGVAVSDDPLYTELDMHQRQGICRELGKRFGSRFPEVPERFKR